MCPRRATIVALADCVKQPPTGVGSGAGTDRTGDQRGQRERRHDLDRDEEERVVRGVGVRERSDVQGSVDMRCQAPPCHLGDDDEKRESR
jgi:hypothetical protein